MITNLHVSVNTPILFLCIVLRHAKVIEYHVISTFIVSFVEFACYSVIWLKNKELTLTLSLTSFSCSTEDVRGEWSEDAS